METTLKEYGRNPEYVLQPDYQFSHNGYGLLQLACNFDIDISRAGESSSVFVRGSAFPSSVGALGKALSGFGWTLVKADEVGRDGKLARVRAFYAAIEGKETVSQTEATITSSAVTESIESHPNFSVSQVPAIGVNGETHNGKKVPLGGLFTSGTPPILQSTPDPKNPFRAYWYSQPGFPGVFPWQFIGFLPSTDNTTVNRKAGVKSWFRPAITLKLVAYTSDAQKATETGYTTGWIITQPSYGIFNIPEIYQNIVEQDPIKPETGTSKNWLVTGTNVEIYGGLYKVTADLLLSGVIGWDPDIYPSQDSSAIG